MVRDNRVKRYSFQGAELLASTGTASGIIDIFSSHDLNGELRVVQVLGNNYNATGSVFLMISGTNEIIWQLISGTATEMISSTSAYLPMASARTTQNTNLSGAGGAGVWTSFPIFGPLRLVGSGLGSGKSGTQINIGYV